MNYNSIPQSLRDTALWCVWRYQTRDGESKPTKVPYNPLTGKGAKSNDRSTFGTFGQALFALEAQGYDGLGIGLFDDLCAIDLDHCVDEDGAFTDLASDIVCEMNTYAEMSPSGEGLHLYFRAPGLVYDKEKYYIKNSENGVEVYVAGATNRFLTVTGSALTDAGLNDRTEQLQTILDKYMVRKVKAKRVLPDGIPTVRLTLSDDNIIKKARDAKNGTTFKRLMDGDMTGYSSQNEADLALCNILAFWTSGDAEQMDRIFRTSGLMRPKWDEGRAATTYGSMTIQNAIGYTDKTYSDTFSDRMVENQPMPKKARKGGGGMYGW